MFDKKFPKKIFLNLLLGSDRSNKVCLRHRDIQHTILLPQPHRLYFWAQFRHSLPFQEFSIGCKSYKNVLNH